MAANRTISRHAQFLICSRQAQIFPSSNQKIQLDGFEGRHYNIFKFEPMQYIACILSVSVSSPKLFRYPVDVYQVYKYENE